MTSKSTFGDDRYSPEFYFSMGAKRIAHMEANGTVEEQWNFGILAKSATKKAVLFSDVGKELEGSGEGKTVLLYDAVRQVMGRDLDPGPQRIGDCFPAGTLVTMADGSERPIESVKVGERVLTHTGESHLVLETLQRRYSGPMLTLQSDRGRKVTATKGHQFYERGYDWGWKGNDSLRAGSVLAVNNHPGQRYRHVDIVEDVTSVGATEVPVYCLHVEKDHSFTANRFAAHNCVSWGWSAATDVVACVQAVINPSEEFSYDLRTCTEAFYALSRVEYGNLDGSYSDGSVGEWANEAALKGGTFSRKRLGPYDPKRAKEWGAKGVPDDIELEGKLHLFQASALVTSYEQARDCIANGIPVPVCSGVGFEGRRDSEGFIKRRGSWNHCYQAGTKIAGPVFKNIEDVKVGDVVYDHQGNARRVTELFSRPYRGSMVRISVGGGRPTTMTQDHPVMVYRRVMSTLHVPAVVGSGVREQATGDTFTDSRKWSFRPCWVSASAVRPGDYLVSPGINATDPVSPEWVCPEGRRCKLPALLPTSELAWLFGFCIGDANFAKSHKVVLRIGYSKPWERVVTALRSLGVTVTTKKSPTFVEIRAYSATLADSCLAWFFGEDGKRCIPDWLLTWNRESLIAGLTDADGCHYKGMTRFTTVSHTLALQVRMLLVSLGYGPYCRTKEPGKGAYENGQTQHEVEWRAVSKHNHIKNLNGIALLKVKSVVFFPYVGTVHNLEVEETHSYIADGYATHNCMCFIGCKDVGRKGLLIKQSWGNDHEGEPKGEYDLPDCCWWVDASTCTQMLSERDSFAPTRFMGYVRQNLPWVV